MQQTLTNNPDICYVSSGTPFSGQIFLEENMLLFVQEGQFNLRYGNTTYKVAKQEVAFLKKNILIDYQFTGSFFMFVLKDELVLEFLKLSQSQVTLSDSQEMITVDCGVSRLFNYMASLRPYFYEDGTIQENLVKLKLLELLFCLAKSNRKIFAQVLDLRDSFRSNITSVVEENITNSLSLYQLARLSGRSLSSFRRDFLSIYNMPPSQWIRAKRLEKAQELLNSTNMTVTSICYTLGFESVAHFSRIFKSRFGIPPSELRMMQAG